MHIISVCLLCVDTAWLWLCQCGPVLLDLRGQWCGQAVQQPYQCLSELQTASSIVVGRSQVLLAGWLGRLLRGGVLEPVVGQTLGGVGLGP